MLHIQYTFFMLLWERSHNRLAVLYDFADCQDSHLSRCFVLC
jgi:hypothetical protein